MSGETIYVISKVSEVHQTVCRDFVPQSMRAIYSAEFVSWEDFAASVYLMISFMEAREMISQWVDIGSHTDSDTHGDRVPQKRIRDELFLPEEGPTNFDQDSEESGGNSQRLSEGQVEFFHLLSKSWHVFFTHESWRSSRDKSVAKPWNKRVGHVPGEEQRDGGTDEGGELSEVVLRIVRINNEFGPLRWCFGNTQLSKISSKLTGCHGSWGLRKLSNDSIIDTKASNENILYWIHNSRDQVSIESAAHESVGTVPEMRSNS